MTQQTPRKIGLVGIGKIARDQHIPHIDQSPDFTLAAAVTKGVFPPDIEHFPTLAAMKEMHPDISAVSICTPPIGRLELIQQAFDLGFDVMIEKPPAATMSEAQEIVNSAKRAGKVLYVTWHSREARAVAPAKKWLSDANIKAVHVNWKEDVRVWHPGQSWIWGAGIGVFDPGINALSVITEILPSPLLLDAAELYIPTNKPSPMAANLDMKCGDDIPVRVEFDFDKTGEQVWEIIIETDKGQLHLSHGASKMAVNGQDINIGSVTEYAGLYARFAQLLKTGQSDTDLRPFQLVNDAFVLGTRHAVEAFEDF